MTAASNSEARKRATEAASNSESAALATNSPKRGDDTSETANGPQNGVQPIPAPVDSGTIGRLNEAVRGVLVETFAREVYGRVMEATADRWRQWRYLTEAAKERYRAEAAEAMAEALGPALADLLREHTDRALAEVEQRIASSVSPNFALRHDGSEDPQAAAYVEGLHDAHEIVRAARQEQGHG
ncbi:hypothetical protein [Nocardioides sp. BYT-33-1]|uniref:hypothetical protein n=1 Tax=Nocardioides sp. BYT-33-1 TaxID=3416952 RepID=UPI003F531ECF